MTNQPQSTRLRRRHSAGDACRASLVERFQRLSLDVRLDAWGYVATLENNLVEGVELSSFEADLRQGGGNELKKKFRAVHSSAALAANTFAPFKANRQALRLVGIGAFDTIKLEGKCPHGVSKSAPNLDALAEGSEGVVAIKYFKLLEPLSPHPAVLSPAYAEKITDDRCRSGWLANAPSPIKAQCLSVVGCCSANKARVWDCLHIPGAGGNIAVSILGAH